MPVGFGLNLLALAAATEGPNLLAGRQLEQENQLEKPVDIACMKPDSVDGLDFDRNVVDFSKLPPTIPSMGWVGPACKEGFGGDVTVACMNNYAVLDHTCIPKCSKIQLEVALSYLDETIDLTDNSLNCTNGEACNVKCFNGVRGKQITCDRSSGAIVPPTCTSAVGEPCKVPADCTSGFCDVVCLANPEDVYQEIRYDWANIEQPPIVSKCNGYTKYKRGGMLVTAVPIERGNKYYYYFHAVAHYIRSPITKIVIGGSEKVEYKHTTEQPLDDEKNGGCKGTICFIDVHKYRRDLLHHLNDTHHLNETDPKTLFSAIKIVEFIAGPYNADEKISFTASRPAYRGLNRTLPPRSVSLTVEIDGSGNQGDKCHREELKQESGKRYYFVPQRDDVPDVAPPKKRDEDFVVTTYNVYGIEAEITYKGKKYVPHWEEKDTMRRLILIGKYVQSINPDIIGFTEVFGDYQVNILLEMLRDHCRHFAAPPRDTPWWKINGGLLICSKYPIEHQDWHSFPSTLGKLRTGLDGSLLKDLRRFTVKKTAYKIANDYVEALCDKGVMTAQVNIPWEHGQHGGNHNVQVFLAHTLSTNGKHHYMYAEQRLEQFEVIHKAMQTGLLMGQHFSPITQQILMGDLNVDAVPSSKSCKDKKMANGSDEYFMTHPWNLEEYEKSMMKLLNGGNVTTYDPLEIEFFVDLNTLDTNKDVKLRDPVYEPKKKSDNIPIISHGDDDGCPTTWNTKNTWNIAAGEGDKHSQYLDYILFTDQTNQAFTDSFFHDNYSLKNITIGNPESATNAKYLKENDEGIMITTYHKELSDHRPLIYAWKSIHCGATFTTLTGGDTCSCGLTETCTHGHNACDASGNGTCSTTVEPPCTTHNSADAALRGETYEGTFPDELAAGADDAVSITCPTGKIGTVTLTCVAGPGVDMSVKANTCECRDGMSLCDDGINCVSDDERCDVNFDCSDESDEKHCPWDPDADAWKIDPDADA